MALSHIDMDIADVLMEKPFYFSIGHRQYCLYPATLGKMQLMSRIIDALGIVKEGKPDISMMDMLFTVKEKRDVCCRLIAYNTLPGSDCLKEPLVRKRIKAVRRLNDEGIATLVSTILSSDKYTAISSHFGIDKERKRMEQIMRVKKRDKSSLVFGGKSVWGALIDCACERYGWSFQYVVWGISYCNLLLLINDQYREVFLSDKERKEAHISTDGVLIEASDTESLNNFIKHSVWR